MMIIMHGMRKAMIKSAVLLLRPLSSGNIEHVSNNGSYPNLPIKNYIKNHQNNRFKKLMTYPTLEIMLEVEIHS